MTSFRFKQFSVLQREDVFKVGTDGVLLGAWSDVQHAESILEVGTGSGLVALMLRQRCEASVNIDCLDINRAAVDLAQSNFDSSPWPTSFKSFHVDFKEFQSKLRYDVIVCNPPFFAESTLPKEAHLHLAKHTTSFDMHLLFKLVAEWLSDEGHIDLIIPFDQLEAVVEKAHIENLFEHRITTASGVVGDRPNRVLISFGKKSSRHMEEQHLSIYDQNRHWTDKYWDLTENYYLKRK